jgi:hypothetical protein
MRHAILSLGALAGGLALGAGAAGAASPVQGSISGPVVSVKGTTFTVTTSLSPSGKSAVTVVSSTRITAQAAGTSKNVKKGLCVTALGTKDKKGVVTAQRVTLRAPVKGSCTGGFAGRGGRGGGTPPANRQRPPGSGGGNGFRGNANFAFATGTVSVVKGTTVTVKGTTGTTTVVLAKKTQIDRTLTVGAKAIKLKLCAFVYGTSSDKGLTVKAQSVALSKPGANGCNARFRGNGP